MSLGPVGRTGRTALAQLGRCGWRSSQSRQFRASPMSGPQDTHLAKKPKTTETKKVTLVPPCFVVADLTDFRVSFRSSARTTVPSTAMRPWQCTCSGKRRPTLMQVRHANSVLRSVSLTATPVLGRLDPNERPGNIGYLRYSCGRRGRVR